MNNKKFTFLFCVFFVFGITVETLHAQTEKNLALAQKKAKELHDKAYELYKSKRYQSSLDTILKAIRLVPDNGYYYSLAAYDYVKMEKYQQAQTYNDTALLLVPYDADYLQFRANIWAELKRYAAADSAYDDLLSYTKTNGRLYYNAIYNLSQLKNDPKTIALALEYDSLKRNGSYMDEDEDGNDVYFYAANAYLRQKDTQNALKFYNRAIETKPYYAYFSNRGLIYENRGKYADALLDLNDAVKYAPDSASVYYNRGMLYDKMGMDKEAYADMLKAEKMGQNTSDFYNDLGNIYRHHKELQKSKAAFEKAMKLDPGNPMLRNNIALLMSDLGNDTMSRNLLLSSAKDYRPEANFFNLANDYREKKDYRQAIAYYDSAIAYLPYFHDAYLNRGLCYNYLGNDSLAIQSYGFALINNPNDYKPYVNRAASFKKLMRYPEAESDLKKAFSLNPSELKTRYALAKLYYEWGNIPKSKAIYEELERLKFSDEDYFVDYSALLTNIHADTKGLEILQKGAADFPQNADLQNNLANVYEDLKNTPKAIEHYQKAIKLDPADFSYSYNLGNLYYHHDSLSKAIESYGNALKVSPHQPQVLLNLANVYADQSNYPKATETLTECIKYNPNYNDAYLNRGSYYKEMGKTIAANQDFQHFLNYIDSAKNEPDLLKTDDDNGDIHLQKARIYQLMDRLQAAANEYKTYLYFHTTDAGSFDNYGYILFDLNQIAEAQTAFENGYRLEPKNADILVGLMATNCLLGNKESMKKYRTELFKQKPYLSGIEAILDMLHAEGYTYTDNFKGVFQRCCFGGR